MDLGKKREACVPSSLLSKNKKKPPELGREFCLKMEFPLSFCHPIRRFKVSPAGEYPELELQSAGGMSRTPPSKISTPPSRRKASQKGGEGKKDEPPNRRDHFGRKRLKEESENEQNDLTGTTRVHPSIPVTFTPLFWDFQLAGGAQWKGAGGRSRSGILLLTELLRPTPLGKAELLG